MSEQKAVPEMPEATECPGCADLSHLLAEENLKRIRDRQASRILMTTPLGVTQTVGVSLDIEHYNKLIDDLNQANALLFETRKLRDELVKKLGEQVERIATLTAERDSAKRELAELQADAKAERKKYEALREENAALKATVERLSAPVTVQDLKRHGVQGLCAASAMRGVSRLIASRTTPSAKERS